MRYIGGKGTIGREISLTMRDAIPPSIDPKHMTYLEPFCGALGVFQHMSTYGYKKCIGSDLQPDLIRLWNALKTGSFRIPTKSISKQQYNAVCSSPRPSARRAAIGYGLGFRGRFCKGFDHRPSAIRALTKNLKAKALLLESNPRVHFLNKDYKLWKPTKALVYCDPPYRIKYRSREYFRDAPAFDHKEFWDIMRKWSKKNYVFVSELEAPKDFKCIWSKKVPTHLGGSENKTKYRRERLFVLRKSPADGDRARRTIL